jgi:hypothetical protein
MSKFRRNTLKYFVNEKFFDKRTSQMAYILGFAFADGNIYKTSLSWDIQKRDLNILEKINKVLSSNYPIKERRETSYRLRINNQILIAGAISKGLLPKKSLRLIFPNVPRKFLRHFIRGYLDGDGWIILRLGRNEIDVGFVCGNKSFLKNLSNVIASGTSVKGRVREKNKITLRGVKSKTFLMEYYSSNAFLVADWLYDNLNSDDVYLDRKYMKYLKAKELNNYLKSGTRKVRVIQKQLGKPLSEILRQMYINKRLDGVQMAQILRVHSSSIYRWLARFGIKYPIHRKIIYGQS